MAYTRFDPRDDLIACFTTDVDYDRDGTDEKCVQVTDDNGETLNVPVLKVTESRVGSLPYLPLVEVAMISSPSHLTNLGQTRFNDCIIDFNIYIQNMDNVTVDTFLTDVANEIIENVTSDNQSASFPAFLHTEIIEDGRLIVEEVGGNMTFHLVVSIRANRYDSG